MDAGRPVNAHRARANKLRKFAGGPPPQKIHLEKPVLRMDPPERACDVGPGFSADRRHPEPIPLDGGGTRQAGKLRAAVELRPARAHLEIKPAGRDAREQHHHTEQAREQPENFGNAR